MASTGRPDPYFVWESISIESLVDNPPLIEVLKKTNDSATAKIRELERKVRDLQRIQSAASNELTEVKASLAESQERAARLDERLIARDSEIADLRRRARISVIVAWVGTLAVAIGVNYLTSDSNQNAGWVLLGAGALIEVLAFFVGGSRLRQPTNNTHDNGDSLAH